MSRKVIPPHAISKAKRNKRTSINHLVKERLFITPYKQCTVSRPRGATSYIAQCGVATEWEQHRTLRSAVSRPNGSNIVYCAVRCRDRMGATKYIAQCGVATKGSNKVYCAVRCRDRMGATSYIAQCGEYQKQDTCVPTGRDKKKQLKVVLLIACNYSLKFLVDSKCEIHKFSNSQILDK